VAKRLWLISCEGVDICVRSSSIGKTVKLDMESINSEELEEKTLNALSLTKYMMQICTEPQATIMTKNTTNHNYSSVC